MRCSFFILLLTLLTSCGGGRDSTSKVIIFHAGSLSVPLKQMEHRYEYLNPDIDIQLEGAGSVACTRKITDLKRDCDIIASADYKVIDKMLIPDYCSNNICFASNAMVIAFTDKSTRANEININTWPDILLDKDVIYGRSDPDSDPCGYRSVMTMKLADIYYGRSDITERLMQKDQNMIRPKEVDLVALIQTGVIDYFFIYRSVAQQHKLRYIELPDEINLGKSEFNEKYADVSVMILGSSPDKKIEMIGGEMIYGISILDKAPNINEAIRFMEFFLSEEGRSIIVLNGQSEIYPPIANKPYDLPEPLFGYFKELAD